MEVSTSALFELLSRRGWLLGELREGESTAAELAATSDVSQATVRRGLADLAEAGLVEPGERHSVTLAGRVVHDQFRRSTGRLSGIGRAASWLASLPTSASLAPEALDDATVHEGEAARSRRATLAADATALSGCLLTRRPAQVRAFLPRTGVTLDLVVPSALTRQLLADCQQRFVDRLADDEVTVHETDDLPPYSLLLATVGGRRHVCLGFHDDGDLRALAETGSGDAVEWAVERVADLRASATAIEPP